LMEPRIWIERTEALVQEQFAADATGHDWPHIRRVRDLALRFARELEADLLIVELGALLHDIADWKFHDGDSDLGPRKAADWLLLLGAPGKLADQVATIVKEISFKGAGVATPMSTLEGQIVQDADRIEALGAIGIARAFAYGGSKGRVMHDPAVPPLMHASFEAYKKDTGPTLNHFYEKLFLLKDRMNTEPARRLAEHRHQVMERFVNQFLAEWDCIDESETGAAR
jgi:uncharacterized protein